MPFQIQLLVPILNITIPTTTPGLALIESRNTLRRMYKHFYNKKPPKIAHTNACKAICVRLAPPMLRKGEVERAKDKQPRSAADDPIYTAEMLN